MISISLAQGVALFIAIPMLWPALHSVPAVASLVATYALGSGLGMLLADRAWNRAQVKISLVVYIAVGIFGSILLYVSGKLDDPKVEIESGVITWFLGGARFF